MSGANAIKPLPRYAELQVTSHFSFLRGASSCDELFAQAAHLGIKEMAIVDRNSIAGIVRAYEAAKTNGIRLIVGCRLDLNDGMSVLVYPMNRSAYARLCRLLSLGKSRAGKAKCHLDWADLIAYGEGLIVVLVPDEADDLCASRLRRLSEAFGNRAYMALTLRRRPNDQLRLFELSNMATSAQVPTVVTNDVLFHAPARRMLQDVVTCIRHGCTIDDAGFRRERYADRYLKPPTEMHRLFARYPEALARTGEIAERCRFSLEELTYQYPEEALIPGLTPQQALAKLAWEGAAERYENDVPEEVIASLKHELALIERLEYAPYFLTVNSIVRFARSQDILCQGRGSAANSAVCYVLGITAIDPGRNDLLFERFVSEERREPPDIDVDFEHERRETVMQWVFETYGRDHAALCSTVIRYRTKGALRDAGKALGLPEDLIAALNAQVWGWSEEGFEPDHAKELNLNFEDRRLKLAIDLARELIGTPRHLSQHPGGFVLTRDRLDELVPIVLQYRVRAAIIMTASLSSKMADMFREHRIPTVMLNRYSTIAPGNSVTCDNVEGGKAVAAAFVAAGFNLFAYVGGAPASSTGGQYRNEVEGQRGLTYSGFGARLSEDWKSATFVSAADSTVGNLSFSGITTLNLRLFDNLGQQPAVYRRYPVFKGVRVSLAITNLLDQRIVVRDGAGVTPLNYQPGFIDPVGRAITVSFRKLFY